VDEFHSLVSIKSEKMQQLTKEKTELVAQLKVDEAENLSNNEKLKGMAQAGLEMEQSQEGVTRQLTKELDKHKKKIQRLATQQTRTEETIRDIRGKIAEIGRAMPYLTSEVEFLGLDRNDSEYFFYVREPDRLYVKFRSYLLNRN
jgi:chromosome segregation ATPase